MELLHFMEWIMWTGSGGIRVDFMRAKSDTIFYMHPGTFNFIERPPTAAHTNLSL